MKRKFAISVVMGAWAIVGVGVIYAQAHDKYTVKVPGGLAFSEFRGYESWEMIGVSRSEGGPFAVILGNPTMIEALKAGIPDNGKPVPDGAKMAKMHYAQQLLDLLPVAMVSGVQLDIDFMVKDSARFADGNGWGYAAFQRDPASGEFTPFTLQNQPPQANDAKCGVACHTAAKSRDYVFTRYATR